MKEIHHKIDKNIKVAHGHIKDFDKIEKEKNLIFLAVIALIVIVLYFLYVFGRVVLLFKTIENPTNQLVLILPHLVLLSLFGVPIVRQVLLWIKFTPFYLPKKVIRKMQPKTYNKIRLKRFAVYFVVSLICFLIAISYLFIL